VKQEMSLMLHGARLDMMIAKRKQAGGIMDSRAQFEEWIEKETGFDIRRTNYPMTKSEDQQYADHNTNFAWKAWQASREAIEVELPEKISPHNRNESGYVIAQAAMYDEAIDDCAQAVKECGISIKKDLPLQYEAKEG
jgi:hypothetical protein